LKVPPGKENQPVKCPFCAHIDDKVIDSRKAASATPFAGGANA